MISSRKLTRLHLHFRSTARPQELLTPLAASATPHIDTAMARSKKAGRPKISDAANNVFGTFELLEAILLLLPPRDLLVSSQRVCKRWQAVISNSIYIQQKLFYRQTSSTRNGKKHSQTVNLFLVEILRLGGASVLLETSGGLHVAHSHTRRDYKKLPKKPEVVWKFSWEDMYPTAEPCIIVLIGASRILRGRETRLGSIMNIVDQVAPAGPGIVEEILFRVRRMLLCNKGEEVA